MEPQKRVLKVNVRYKHVIEKNVPCNVKVTIIIATMPMATKDTKATLKTCLLTIIISFPAAHALTILLLFRVLQLFSYNCTDHIKLRLI